MKTKYEEYNNYLYQAFINFCKLERYLYIICKDLYKKGYIKEPLKNDTMGCLKNKVKKVSVNNNFKVGLAKLVKDRNNCIHRGIIDPDLEKHNKKLIEEFCIDIKEIVNNTEIWLEKFSEINKLCFNDKNLDKYFKKE